MTGLLYFVKESAMPVAAIRKASWGDLAQITEIYNDAILHSVATFDTETKREAEQRTWFENHQGRNGVWVAEDTEEIVGWASLSPWSDRCAYSDTVENSVYVRPNRQGKGIGTLLLREMLEHAEKEKVHTIIARIVAGNAPSVRLHERFGFTLVGVMKEVGFKFGKRLDVYLMQLMVKDRPRGK